MKLKYSLLFIALLSTTTGAIGATDSTEVNTTPVGAELASATKGKLAGANKPIANEANACQFDIKFASKAQQKNQSIQASPTVSMDLTQFIATKVVESARIASNVTCQHLIGHTYTGSQQEWAGFIDSGIKGLLKAGVTDIQFTKVGANDAAYKGTLDNMEYVFTGDNGGNKQVIHNLTVLDKPNNQVITLSVSGNEKVAQEIKDEYQRLVASFKP
ncbi:hypothetical protein [Pseudoalteromonas distincta]|uniref:hypothetical protein n=1 Tax=Pseudoalteromonas distincta TaxID=77608 RepID=UPI00186A1215|nr:hypothetical protein [Pseudoalteromonas distincta]MBE3672539.1 hypothetical protein [Pseudoalteromonas distincta KMM 3548]